MNKLFFTAFLLAASTILLGNDLIDIAKDKVIDKAKDKLDDFLGDSLAADLAKEAFDYIGSDPLKKTTDSHWSPFSLNHDPEPQFNESIDRFFTRFNSPDSTVMPLELHLLGSKATPRAPLLETNCSSTTIPTFSSEDRPIDFISGGLHAAKNMDATLISARAAQKDGVYRHLVGLEVTSSLMASAVKQIVTWGNQLNAMSIQSYDMAAAITPGMWPKIQRGASYACEHEKIANGYDLIEAKTLCQDKATRDQTLQALSQKNEQILVGSFNIADKILTQMGVGKTKEILMNMTGTLISKNAEEIEHYPPLHREVIALLRDGRKIENGYSLKSYGLEISRGPVSLPFPSQKNRILDLFKSIQHKLRTDSDFSDEEKSLLSTSHFPMASFITLMTQYKGSGSTLILERYSDLIAFERVIEFMEEAAESILHKAESLRAVQIAGYELEAYIKQVREVLTDLHSLKTENLQKITNEQKALDSLIQIDKELRDKARI